MPSFARLILFVFLAAIWPAPASAQAEGLALEYQDGLGNTMPYRLFVPPNYDPSRQYPLILFLHGGDESGTDNLAQVSVHIEGLIAKTQTEGEYASFLVAPQTVWGWSAPPAPGLVFGILDELEAQYSVDERREYVTGLSMGGFGTFELLAEQPDRFAAGVPLSAYNNLDVVPLIKDIPLWIIHGRNDNIVPVTYSRDIVAALRAAGGDPLYSELIRGHGSWNRIYNGLDVPDLYPWLYSQALPVPEPSSVVLGLIALGGLWAAGTRRSGQKQPS